MLDGCGNQVTATDCANLAARPTPSSVLKTRATKPPHPNDKVGLLFAVASCFGMGLAMVVARFAYDGGANGLALGTARSVFFVPAVFLFCCLSKRSLSMSFRDWLQCAGLGVFMAGAFYGHVASVEFLPIGLAAILFFTFPPLIAVLHAVVLREPPGLAKTISLLVAFAGLTLMLGVSIDSANPRGLALALGASVCVAWSTFWTAQRISHIDGVVAVFHMGVVAMVLLVSISWITGTAVLPQTQSGWAGLAGVVLLQTLSLPLFYLAIPRIGSLKAGMLANVQPLSSIVLAFLVFGELLSGLQLVGGGMVLAGIWLMQRQDRGSVTR